MVERDEVDEITLDELLPIDDDTVDTRLTVGTSDVNALNADVDVVGIVVEVTIFDDGECVLVKVFDAMEERNCVIPESDDGVDMDDSTEFVNTVGYWLAVGEDEDIEDEIVSMVPGGDGDIEDEIGSMVPEGDDELDDDTERGCVLV